MHALSVVFFSFFFVSILSTATTRGHSEQEILSTAERERERERERELIGVEPSQPLGITSGLKETFIKRKNS